MPTKTLTWKSSEKLCSPARDRYILEQLSMKPMILQRIENPNQSLKIARSTNFLKQLSIPMVTKVRRSHVVSTIALKLEDSFKSKCKAWKKSKRKEILKNEIRIQMTTMTGMKRTSSSTDSLSNLKFQLTIIKWQSVTRMRINLWLKFLKIALRAFWTYPTCYQALFLSMKNCPNFLMKARIRTRKQINSKN